MAKGSHLKILFLLLLMVILLCNSSVSRQGTYYGLILWYQSVIPSLFPFMVLTTLLSETLGNGGLLYTVFVGFLCGYPMGAKTAADLYKQKRLSLAECQLAAGFCNLPSPMFMIGYAELRKELPVIYITAAICILIGKFYIQRKKYGKHSDKKNFAYSLTVENTGFSIRTFEISVMNCCAVLLKIGIYLVLFSIAAAFLHSVDWIPNKLAIYLTCLLELTTGTNIAANTPSLAIPSAILISCTCTFGGLCGIAQTKSVMDGVPFSIPLYILCKIFHMVLVGGILMYLL